MLYLTRNRPGLANPRPFENGIDRLIEEMTHDLGFAPSAAGEFEPLLDVFENESAWLVRADLPGIDPAGVEVSVTGNVLTVRGEKKADEQPDTATLRRTERRHGKFVRSLEFPTDLDASKVEAHSKNGVLTITLPKVEAARPRTITVKAV